MAEITKEKIYKLTIEGTGSVNDYKNAIEQLNEQLKTLNQTSKEYKETLEEISKLQSKLSEGFGNIDTGALDSFIDGFVEGINEAASGVSNVKANIEDLGSINSVKDLKNHISDLRDKLVTLENGSDDYKATVQELIDAQVKLKEVMNAGKNEVQAAEGSYNALSQRMSALKQVWKETTDEATRSEIGKQINEINNELKAMDASIGNNQRNVGNYKSALEGLDGAFVGWKQELKECKDALQQLDPSTQEYADTMARAAELSHNLADQQEMIKYSSTDLGDQLNNIRGIAGNLAAGYSAVNAAMGLFGEENKDLQQAMLKVQQAMALVQGLQGLDGFIKRTKGLSQSMGLVTKATQANTIATKANAAAAKSDAAAKGAEAVATQGAVGPQLALNAAMKANPIGFIIGLIASLVTAIVLFKDKIKEWIGANEELTAAFDKLKAILSGFGNIIKKNIINPVKACLIPLKTMAKLIVNMINGEWDKIGDTLGESMQEAIDIAKDSFNILGSFAEGYNKKREEQEEARRKKEAAEREKELDNIIKDNEAKYGSDWKYTEEAQKLYDEMFKVRMAQYKEDSDEYREANRDKMAYDRELAEHQNKANEDAKKKDSQAALAAKKENEKMLSDFKSTFEKYMPNWNKYELEINETFEKWIKGYEVYTKELLKKFIKNGDSTIEAAEKVTKELSLIYANWQKSIWNDLYGKEWNSEIEKTFYQMDRTIKDFVENENAYFNKEKIEFGIDFPEDEINHFKKIYKETIKNIKEETNILEKYIDKMYSGALQDINVISNIDVDDEHIKGWIKYLVDNYDMYAKAVQNGNTQIKEDYEQLWKDIINDPWNRPVLENALGVYLSEFQKMLDKRNVLFADENKTETEQFQKLADIYKKVYDKEIDQNQKLYEDRKYWFDSSYEEEKALQEKRAAWSLGTTEMFKQNFLKEQELLKQNLDFAVQYYEQQEAKYIEMSTNMELTAEEREQAIRDAEEMTREKSKAIAEYNTNLIKSQAEQWKYWVDAAKSAINSVGDTMSSLADYYTGLMELEEQRIDQQIKDKKISEDQAEKMYQMQEENFEKAKNFQAAQTIINGLSAAIGAYQAMASIPIVGPALGIAAAAAAMAAAIVNAKKIKETTMSNPYSSTGGGSAGSSSTTNFQLPDVMEYEPSLGRNLTNQSDTDHLNNGGSENDIRVVLVESDVTIAQRKSKRVQTESTF